MVFSIQITFSPGRLSLREIWYIAAIYRQKMNTSFNTKCMTDKTLADKHIFIYTYKDSLLINIY